MACMDRSTHVGAAATGSGVSKTPIGDHLDWRLYIPAGSSLRYRLAYIQSAYTVDDCASTAARCVIMWPMAKSSTAKDGVEMGALRWTTNETLVTARAGVRKIQTPNGHPGCDNCCARGDQASLP
jgi:hypothetical protein